MLQPYVPARLEPIQVAREPLTQQDYDRFKAALPSWRDVLIAKLLRVTGIRIKELLRLQARHYEVTGPEFALLVKRSKRRKKDPGYERVYIPPSLGVELRDYIRGNGIKPGQPVFQSRKSREDQAISDVQVRRIFYAAGEQSLGRPVHPHELRHLYIKTLVDGGVPIEAAAKLIGHSDPRVTHQWYYDLTAEQRRAIGERMPT